MTNNNISVTFLHEGTVRLIRSAKKVNVKSTSSQTDLGIIAPFTGAVSSHDVQCEATAAQRKLNIPKHIIYTLPSFHERRRLQCLGKKGIETWLKLPKKVRFQAHVADIAHDLGSTEWEIHWGV